MHHLAPPGHQGHRPRDLPVVDEPLEVVVDPLQPLGRHAHRLGRGQRQILGRRERGGRRQGQTKADDTDRTRYQTRRPPRASPAQASVRHLTLLSQGRRPRDPLTAHVITDRAGAHASATRPRFAGVFLANCPRSGKSARLSWTLVAPRSDIALDTGCTRGSVR